MEEESLPFLMVSNFDQNTGIRLLTHFLFSSSKAIQLLFCFFFSFSTLFFLNLMEEKGEQGNPRTKTSS